MALWRSSARKSTPMTIGKGISVEIDESILQRLDAYRPSYTTRKVFVNLLLDAGVSKMEKEQATLADSLPQ
jgi:hypothetical protein